MEIDKGLAPMPPAPRARRHTTAVEDFTVFFRSSYRTLLKTAMYAGAAKHEADEAVAAAMREVHRRWAVIEDPLAYARRAVVSNFIKEKTRNLERIRRRQVERGSGTAECSLDPNLAAWEERVWVMQMLRSLPPGQRDVLAFIVDGFTSTEISTLLGRSPEAIRQALHAARMRLKAALKDEALDEQTPRCSTSPTRKEAR